VEVRWIGWQTRCGGSWIGRELLVERVGDVSGYGLKVGLGGQRQRSRLGICPNLGLCICLGLYGLWGELLSIKG
jgi:hypothetical protein